MIRYLSLIVLGAALLVACGGAPTGAAAPTQAPEATAAPAATTQPAAPTQAPEPTAPPAAPSPIALPGKGDPGASTGDMAGVLLVFTRSGGIAGVHETLTIYDDGRIAFAGRNNESTAQVAPEELSELRRLLASPEFAALDGRYPAMGADLFTYSITTPTGGKQQTVVTMDGAKNPPILDQVLAEIGKVLEAQAK